MPETPVLTRAWAMPDKYTFRIAPIAALIAHYVPSGGVGWADPFAGWASPAQFTNDLNPDSPALSHDDARLFVQRLPEGLDGVLFDPPYSPEQIARAYKGIGRSVTMQDTQNGALYATTQSLLGPKVKTGGIAISFGWNSRGFGRARGFEIEAILLVCHGGAHNDTICVVERKRQHVLPGGCFDAEQENARNGHGPANR